MALISLGRNIAALAAQRQLGRSTEALGSTLERLSTGQRINRASDDAAGLAVAARLGNYSRVYTQGIRNANDGLSMLGVAAGSVSSLTTLVTRLKELASQASNGTNSSAQRASLNTEAQTLRDEYNRLLDVTKFNKTKLLDGTLSDLALQLGLSTRSVSLGQNIGTDIGNGSYTVSSMSDTGVYSAVADFNGDGKADIVSSNGSGTISVRLNNGSGGFSTSTLTITPDGGYGGIGDQVAVGDLDGDGDIDFAVTDMYDGGGASAPRVLTYLNNGSGAFSAGTVFYATYYGDGVNDQTTQGFALGDMNADGRADIVLTSSSYFGTTLGYVESWNYSGASQLHYGLLGSGATAIHTNVTLADLDGDGDGDLITRRSSSLYLRRNNGSGFTSMGTLTGSENYAVGDIDGDGDNDIMALTSGTTLTRYVNNGGFSFTSTGLGTVSSAGNLRLYDYDSDGKLDLFTATGTRKGSGSGTFATETTHATTASYTLGDFNGDGAIDFLSTGSSVYLSGTQKYNYMESFSLSTAAAARTALTTFNTYLNRLGQEIGQIGATQSRLMSATNALRAARDNSKDAYSRVVDADVAQETASLVRNQILQQTATSVLAQANLVPRIAIQLLQDDS